MSKHHPGRIITMMTPSPQAAPGRAHGGSGGGAGSVPRLPVSSSTAAAQQCQQRESEVVDDCASVVPRRDEQLARGVLPPAAPQRGALGVLHHGHTLGQPEWPADPDALLARAALALARAAIR